MGMIPRKHNLLSPDNSMLTIHNIWTLNLKPGNPCRYFAAEMPDPYDSSKAWSVKVESEDGEGTCESGQCDSTGEGAEGRASPGLTDPESQAINPLYPYDNCHYTEEGSLAINGGCLLGQWDSGGHMNIGGYQQEGDSWGMDPRALL